MGHASSRSKKRMVDYDEQEGVCLTRDYTCIVPNSLAPPGWQDQLFATAGWSDTDTDIGAGADSSYSTAFSLTPTEASSTAASPKSVSTFPSATTSRPSCDDLRNCVGDVKPGESGAWTEQQRQEQQQQEQQRQQQEPAA